jgi:hypothetical protein
MEMVDPAQCSLVYLNTLPWILLYGKGNRSLFVPFTNVK